MTNALSVAVVDTTFSRINMGAIALDELAKSTEPARAVRTTVPGIKDLAVECKRMLASADICIALGMVGGAKIDMQCAHEASLGIQQAKLLTGKHIIEVFVHENEAWNEQELQRIAENRIRKHVQNAVLLITNPAKLTENAGKGIRQGASDEGPLNSGDGPISIGIVASRFNEQLTSKMIDSAKAQAGESNAHLIEIIEVPGAYDIPLAVKKLLLDKKIDCVAVIGAVITGGTKHDEVITFSLANSLMALSLEFNKPVTLGVMGPGITDKQAKVRAVPYAQRAVDAALELAKRLRR